MKETYVMLLVLPYRVHAADRANEAFKSDAKITYFMIRHAVNTKWAQGMPRTDSRLWAEIQDKLIEDHESQLELTRTQFDWLFDVVNNFDYPGGLSSWRWTLLDHMEDVRRGELKALWENC